MAEGVALRPALVLMQGVQPGEGFSFKEEAGVCHQLLNRSNAVVNVAAVAAIPERHPTQYEPGFEPPPDASWFTLAPESFDIAPQSMQEFNLTISVPEEPALRNRHWMVYVQCGPPANMALGAVLRLRSRVMIETAPAPRLPDQQPTGLAHLAPSVITMQRDEHGQWSGATELGNGSDSTAQYDVLRFSDLWGEDLMKCARYFRQPQFAVMAESWVASKTESWEIAPGAWQKLMFSGAARELEEAHEEVLFIARRCEMPQDPQQAKLLVRTINNVHYSHMELLRLVYPASQEDEEQNTQEENE